MPDVVHAGFYSAYHLELRDKVLALLNNGVQKYKTNELWVIGACLLSALLTLPVDL